MPHHPDARCGECTACQHVAAAKTSVLKCSAPSGPGIGDDQVEFWNSVLERNPCEHPLVIVRLGLETFEGRVLDGDVESEDPTAWVTVRPRQYDTVTVPRRDVEVWEPAKCLEGINFEHLVAALQTMPQTWYPKLVEVITVAALEHNVYQPTGLIRVATTATEAKYPELSELCRAVKGMLP